MFLQLPLFRFKYISIFVLNVRNLKGRHRHLTMPHACTLGILMFVFDHTVGNLTIFSPKKSNPCSAPGGSMITVGVDSYNGLFQIIPAPPCRGTPFFSTPPMEFPTAFLLHSMEILHSMEFPTQVNHPPMEFPTLFTPLPWNFQHFVSIFNPLLGISSPKMPPSMEFSIWKKNAHPHGIFRFLYRGVRI